MSACSFACCPVCSDGLGATKSVALKSGVGIARERFWRLKKVAKNKAGGII